MNAEKDSSPDAQAPGLEQLLSRIYPDREKLKQRLSRDYATARVVFTNGCFDILHPGHVSYLFRARALGDILIVGVNSDESVRRLKGAGRPVNSIQDRCLMLVALACVDFTTIFEDQTPIETLRILQPDIHCKGGDYIADELPESETVRAYGGRIEILPFVPGYSTSSFLERIQHNS
ncbi:MAG: D-glycero-beta-D-manno-heptose 1-phosphate adenylyltransferase [Leptospiraceae bacterium]|nr:D-glycero-beta-D-manno-heptose 1-phosphate adenylyltransferase [Leptospiraceae bacterium]